jgi:Na+(H+)/acetate symporter ActP
MKTVEIIAMVWSIVMALYALIAKVNGAGVLIIMLVKLLSIITLIYFGYRIFMLIP